MEVNLVVEGLKFMVLGMVTVFLFLILMVFVLKLQSKILLKFFPPKVQNTSNQSSTVGASNSTLVAVISAAITQFRKQNKQ